MSGKLKSQVDLARIEQNYNVSQNYDETAKWASIEFDLPINGAHVRYWLSKPVTTEQKILLFDIETAPMEVYTWGLWDQNVGLSQIKNDWYLLMWGAKWYGDDTVMFDALNQHDEYTEGNDCEMQVVESIWHLLNEADIVIAQNGVNFDVKKVNAKFLEYGFKQPSYYKVVDTLKIARSKFGFSSNKLDYMAKLLCGEGKNKTDFELWLGCMNGEEESWQEMIDYCIKDVDVLEKVYDQIKPWDSYHPAIILTPETRCNVCAGDSMNYVKDYHTGASTFMIYQCDDCGHQQRSRQNVANADEKATRQVNV